MAADAASYEKFFREADVDKSGSLSYQELKSMLQKSGYKGTEIKIRGLFNAADENADGQISFNEYMAIMGQAEPQVHSCALSRKIFMQFDVNGDGQIDRSELESVFKEMGRQLSQKELDRMMELADKDKSGSISYEEFLTEMYGEEAAAAADAAK